MDALDDFAPEEEQDENDDRPRLAKPGELDDGETLMVEMAAEAEVVETDYDDAVRFEATFVSSDADHDDGPFTAGDDAAVLTWSKRLVRELKQANRRTDGELVGHTLAITASEGEDQYSRTYAVEVDADEGGDD